MAEKEKPDKPTNVVDDIKLTDTYKCSWCRSDR